MSVFILLNRQNYFMDLNKTIIENFRVVAEKRAKRKALTYKKAGVYYSINYGELSRFVDYTASAFQQMGLAKGDRLAIFSHSRPEWVVCDLASMAIGAVTVPIHTTLSPKIIKYILNHCQARIIVVSDESLLNKILLIQNDLEFLEKIVFLGGVDHRLEELSQREIINWEFLIERGKKKPIVPVEILPDNIVSVVYTSGTTGLPRGVMLSHRNFLSNVNANKELISVGKRDIFLSFLPLSHVLERTAGYYVALLSGANIVYAESFKLLSKNLKEVKPTILIAVPRVFEKFYDIIWDNVCAGSKLKKKLFHFALKQKHGTFGWWLMNKLVFHKIRKAMGGHLRFAVSGGASLDPKIAKFFYKLGILILEGYGLTETSPVSAVNSENNFRFGTVGQVIPGCEIKIMPDKEIVIRGPNVMIGYYNDPEETTKVIDSDGWFYTGDLGFIDADNFLTIVGRKKEMMVTGGGKNVWPEVIEQELNRDRFISQSAVIGHGRKFISALIIPDWAEVDLYCKEHGYEIATPEKLISDEKIWLLFQQRIAKINEQLSEHEQVKNFCLLVNEFSPERDELSPTLKLCRHVIENHYSRQIEGVYES